MSENHAPALNRGLIVLETITEYRCVGFNTLQKITGINTSSLNRILKVLMEKNYIVRNQEGKYELGMRLFTLTYDNLIWNRLRNNVHEALSSISEQFRVSLLFIVFLRSEYLVLDKVAHPDNMEMRDIGNIARDYLHTPWGALYISNQDRSQWGEFINWATERTPSGHFISIMRFNEIFAKFIQKHGYADDRGLMTDGIRRIAAPVYLRNGELAASLTAGSFSELVDEDTIVALADEVKKKASGLTELLKITN